MPVPSRPVFVCGGDERPGSRGTDCPDSLHDHPLPGGYVAAGDVAARRLRQGWCNVKCRRCGLYGWIPAAAPPARPAENEE
jgi:hypothetical protein